MGGERLCGGFEWTRLIIADVTRQLHSIMFIESKFLSPSPRTRDTGLGAGWGEDRDWIGTGWGLGATREPRCEEGRRGSARWPCAVVQGARRNKGC